MKRGNFWWIDFMYNKERVRKSSPSNSKAGAQAFEVYIRQIIAKHGSVKAALAAMKPRPEDVVPTFAEFTERWLQNYVDVHNKPSERYSKRVILRRSLIPTFGRRKLDTIGVEDIDRYMHMEKQRGLSNKSINNALAVLCKCLKTAADWNVITKVPRFRFLKLPPLETRVVAAGDADRLLAACPLVPWRSLILTALRTGLRFNELIALEWSDVDFDEAILTVRRGEWRGHVGSAKTNETRVIPLTAEVMEALRSLPRCHERVFTNRGLSLKYEGARWNLRKYCRLAGISHTSWHPLRHTFATELNAASASIKHIQELLGHKTLTMTLRYTHSVTAALRNTVALIERRKEFPQIVTILSQHTDSRDVQPLSRPRADTQISLYQTKSTAGIAVLGDGSS